MQNTIIVQPTLPVINNVTGLFARVASIGSVAIYLLVSLAVVYIVYSIVQYFIKGKEGDEYRREAGMQILWGIVGLAIIISLWGLVGILVRTFATNTTTPAGNIPNANFVQNQSSNGSPFGTPTN